MTAVVDMVRTYNNRPYIFGRYVKEKPDPTKDIPYNRDARLTLVTDGQVTPTAEVLSHSLKSAASAIDQIPGSELSLHGPSGASGDTAEIRIKVPVSALGTGGVAFLIDQLHSTGLPSHIANWSEFHGENAIVPEGLKDREPVPA